MSVSASTSSKMLAMIEQMQVERSVPESQNGAYVLPAAPSVCNSPANEHIGYGQVFETNFYREHFVVRFSEVGDRKTMSLEGLASLMQFGGVRCEIGGVSEPVTTLTMPGVEMESGGMGNAGAGFNQLMSAGAEEECTWVAMAEKESGKVLSNSLAVVEEEASLAEQDQIKRGIWLSLNFF